MSWLNRLFSKIFSLDIYDDIEYVSIMLWWKVQRTVDTTYLVKSTFRNYFIKPFYSSKRINRVTDETWEKLKYDLVDFLGISDEYKRYLTLISKIQLYKVKFALTKNYVFLTKQLLAEEELKSLYPPGKKYNDYEIKGQIEEIIGIPIDPETKSVVEYYSYIENIKKRAKNGRSNKK